MSGSQFRQPQFPKSRKRTTSNPVEKYLQQIKPAASQVKESKKARKANA